MVVLEIECCGILVIEFIRDTLKHNSGFANISIHTFMLLYIEINLLYPNDNFHD